MPRFNHAPVIHTLAQVVFTEVLPLVERIADIQGHFIKAGYPHFERQQLMNLAINISPQMIGTEKRIARSERFQFLHKSRTRVAWLTSSSIVFATSEYEDYERFTAELQKVLAAVFVGSLGVTDGALVQRVGLRFTDRVVPAIGEQIADYVVPGLLGFPFHGVSLPEDSAHTLQVVSTATTGLGQLIVRSVSVQGPQILPPDIADTPLVFRIRTPEGQRLHQRLAAERPGLTLDFDHFADLQTADVDLSTKSILQILESLHEILSEAFAGATTDFARTKWQGTEEASNEVSLNTASSRTVQYSKEASL